MDYNEKGTIDELWAFFKSWNCEEEEFRSLEGIPFTYSLTNTNLIIVYCEDQFGKYERCNFLKQQLLDVLTIILESEELLEIKEYADIMKQHNYNKNIVSYLLPICRELAEYQLNRESRYEIKRNEAENEGARIVELQHLEISNEEEIDFDDVQQLKNCRTVLFHPRMEASYRKLSSKQREEIDEVCNAFSTMNENELCVFLQRKNNKRLRGVKSKIDKVYINHNSGHRLLWCNGSDIDKYRFGNSIIMLDYVDDHETQGKVANRCDLNVNFSNAQNAAHYIKKSIDDSTGKIIPPYSYRQGMLIPNLTNSQKDLLLIDPPAMLLGGAGAGKTQISIYLFVQMYKNGKKPIYITYTDQLASQVLKELIALGIDQKYAFDHVYRLSNFLSKNIKPCDKKYSLIDFDDFSYWKRTHLNKRSHSSLVVIDDWIAWTYIRGVIKGGAIDRTSRAIDKKRFVSWMNNREGFDVAYAEGIYQIWLLFQKYCNDENKIDDNDLAWLSMMPDANVQADAVIIDEIQDLTYVQIKAVKNLMSSLSIYMCGDINQRINPTIIDLRTVGREFFNNQNNSGMQVITLGNTFRMGEGIVSFINNLSNIRREYIGKQSAELEMEVNTCREKNDGMWVTLCNNKKISLKNVCNVVKSSSNSIIIVPNRDERQRLLKINPEIDGRVQLVSEAKGLEYDNVVLVNFITNKVDIFNDILCRKLKRNTYARVLINMVYVASTRAKESLVVFEENCPDEIAKVFYKNVLVKDTADDLLRFLSLRADDEGWMIEGKRLENAKDYRSAKLAYKQIKDKCPTRAINRCDAMLKYYELRKMLNISIDELIAVVSTLIGNEDYQLAEELIMENSDAEDAQWLSGLMAVALYRQNKSVGNDILHDALQYGLLGENGFDLEMLIGIIKKKIKINDDNVWQIRREIGANI